MYLYCDDNEVASDCITHDFDSGNTIIQKPRPTKSQRKHLAITALKGGNISRIAKDYGVSRKFVYRQKKIALDAIDSAFIKSASTDQE